MTGPTIAAPPTRAPEDRAAARRRRRAEAWAEAAGAGWKVWLVKIVCLGVIDAMAVYAILVLLTKDSVVIAAVVALGILAINVVYLKPGLLPAKYLTPGLVFLFVFQIFVVLYCIYIAFTNYGSGHVSTKDDAVNALLIQNQQRVEDSAAYPMSVLEKDGALFFLVTTPDGTAEIGSADQPLEAASDAEFTGGRAAALPGYTTLNFAQLVANQATISSMAVPFSTDPNDGTLQTRDGSTAYQYVSTLVWDAAAGTMTNTQTGVVYTDNGNGSFASADGQTLATGWQVWVGVDNFVRAFSTESIRGPFLAVLIWTFVFAILSVATTFALGLFLAIVFNDPRMKSKKY